MLWVVWFKIPLGVTLLARSWIKKELWKQIKRKSRLRNSSNMEQASMLWVTSRVSKRQRTWWRCEAIKKFTHIQIQKHCLMAIKLRRIAIALHFLIKAFSTQIAKEFHHVRNFTKCWKWKTLQKLLNHFDWNQTHHNQDFSNSPQSKPLKLTSKSCLPFYQVTCCIVKIKPHDHSLVLHVRFDVDALRKKKKRENCSLLPSLENRKSTM